MNEQGLDMVWNSLFWGFCYCYYDYDNWVGLFCLFFSGISILNWRNISHKSCNYSKPIYFCSNLQSDELPFFWWKITHSETRIPIISTNMEWWHRKLCHKVTQELHIRAKEKLEQVWWKVIKKFSEGILRKYYIYFKLPSGQLVPLYFTKKNKKITRF